MSDPIYRTTAERTTKMMVIMLGICVAGGVIFFALWDYWISAPPPIVAMMEGEQEEFAEVELSGTEIDVALSFVESSNGRILGFNALPGEEDSNPTIQAQVGDKILFNVINDGRSFHAFGVTPSESGTSGVISGSEVAAANNPLSAGQGGQSEFVAPKEGVFYYICTVAGHREQGMVGTILVGEAEAPEPQPVIVEPVVEEPAAPVSEAVELEGTISAIAGSSLPGCDADNTCYTPGNALVSVGDTVTWSNDDTAAHTVTSDDDIFDSGLFAAGAKYSFTFDEKGEYPYYCLVHPHMRGTISVGDAKAPESRPVIVEPVKEPAATSSEAVELEGAISAIAGSSLLGCDTDNTCYTPGNALVHTGDTVTWSNDDTAAHTVTSDDDVFDSGLFLAGAEYSFTFDEAGEYPYYCLVHPHMRGTITVR